MEEIGDLFVGDVKVAPRYWPTYELVEEVELDDDVDHEPEAEEDDVVEAEEEEAD